MAQRLRRRAAAGSARAAEGRQAAVKNGNAPVLPSAAGMALNALRSRTVRRGRGCHARFANALNARHSTETRMP